MKRLGLLVLFAIMCGCGGSTGDLTGRVLFRGEPLQAGTVTVIGPDNIPRQGAVQAGAYQVQAVPVGEAKILVIAPDSLPNPDWPKEVEPHTLRTEEGKAAKPPAQTAAKPPPGKRQPVSHIYANLQSSPLKVTIKAGANTHDINVD